MVGSSSRRVRPVAFLCWWMAAPNLPDPVTGKALQPGAKSLLWSFNHDTGRWEVQGTMTVSADGRFVDSDPGVGVRQPGWHGVFQGGTLGESNCAVIEFHFI